MSVKKPSRILRVFGAIVNWMIRLALVLAIGWVLFQATTTFATQWTIGQQVSARGAAYVATASAIAPTLVTFTALPSDTPTATLTPSDTPSATATLTPSETSSATNTSVPTLTPTNTPTREPAIQPLQVLVSNTPLASATSGAGSPPLPASNTPLGVQAASTNTMTATVEATLTPTASATSISTPTLTIAPTSTAAPSPTGVVELSLPTLLPPADPDPSHVDVTAVPTRVEPIPRNYNLVNILLLGTDAEITNDGTTRTDTMIIVSINRDTGNVSMLNLPRDLFVWIPAGSMQRLNVAYGWGEAIGWTDGGWGLMRQTIWYNFGINVHYYALVNISEFTEIIDTVGGVDVAVDCAIQDYPLIGAEVPAAAEPYGEDGLYTLGVGYYHLTGAEAVWYARSRNNTLEFDRGRRQQQILRAIWRAARDNGLINSVPDLWDDVIEVVETNIDFNVVLELLPIAANMNSGDIESFTPVRTYHTLPWQPPDGQNVQLPVPETMRELLEDFYTPPSETQVDVEGASVTVYNGTTNENWDRVATDRLLWDGFSAVAAGSAETTDYTETVLIDYSGSEKGSSLEAIARLLNIRPENVRVEPDPNRTSDFAVILGSSYNSCTVEGILPVEGATAVP
jgi:polyisoprenyl-teichoic acid--peptidoglycan teichoic acid transferase